MWVEVRDVRPFLVGYVNGKGIYSLHREGRKGWIVKRYRGKAFVTSPVLFNTARDRYNELLAKGE